MHGVIVITDAGGLHFREIGRASIRPLVKRLRTITFRPHTRSRHIPRPPTNIQVWCVSCSVACASLIRLTSRNFYLHNLCCRATGFFACMVPGIPGDRLGGVRSKLKSWVLQLYTSDLLPTGLPRYMRRVACIAEVNSCRFHLPFLLTTSRQLFVTAMGETMSSCA
jgi:hypothetical protein